MDVTSFCEPVSRIGTESVMVILWSCSGMPPPNISLLEDVCYWWVGGEVYGSTLGAWILGKHSSQGLFFAHVVEITALAVEIGIPH